ncbi:MAG: hypothetical protein MPI95_05050 [Nitrosopumilus sp.]|nr:hypothetical protein [Nitrosopumilus sp.]MDA7942927.1 hypothetical protein [Nitrosopumilus sp.]MDA7953277.1 hypothetical protein [Nitrosopumilus sp.]MDA7958442.1 hypothetical protein [Nitrosopumilus sp.]MDA7959213.1 hypothetical protein [Nitrosopumilus sp.]
MERNTYVPAGVAEHFAHFMLEADPGCEGVVRAKSRGYTLLTLLKLLYAARQGPVGFSDLYAASGIRMKKSFLRYVHLCLECGLVAKSGKAHPSYVVTERGAALMGLLHKDN